MINKNHVYNFIFLTIFIFSLIIPYTLCHKGYDYANILDKGPKSDMTYIFNENHEKNKKENKEIIDDYSKLVDETFKSYQSLFFTDLQTITPLYDQSIKCYFPQKKDISFNDDLYINHNFFPNKTKFKPLFSNVGLNLNPNFKVKVNKF